MAGRRFSLLVVRRHAPGLRPFLDLSARPVRSCRSLFFLPACAEIAEYPYRRAGARLRRSRARRARQHRHAKGLQTSRRLFLERGWLRLFRRLPRRSAHVPRFLALSGALQSLLPPIRRLERLAPEIPGQTLAYFARGRSVHSLGSLFLLPLRRLAPRHIPLAPGAGRSPRRLSLRDSGPQALLAALKKLPCHEENS